MKQKVSVVMCTYNGATYLREQLDSIIGQTLTPYELIAQDDGSTDATVAILEEYAARFPYIKVYRNEADKGINNNFFSAMRRATGDFIAISDQDDIWMPDKLEVQTAAIGDRLMCVARSIPFCSQGDREVTLHYDKRKPNCNIVRMMYASMNGHCTLFRRELLDHIPDHLEQRPIYTHAWYDVITGQTAAALDSIILIDRVVARWRRYVGAASFANYDTKRIRSGSNAWSMVWYGIKNYRRIKPAMVRYFSVRGGYLKSVKGSAPIYHDAVRLMDYESRSGLLAFLGLVRMYMKYRHVIFYTYEKDPVALVRALLHPFMQVYNYRFLLDRK